MFMAQDFWLYIYKIRYVIVCMFTNDTFSINLIKIWCSTNYYYPIKMLCLCYKLKWNFTINFKDVLHSLMCNIRVHHINIYLLYTTLHYYNIIFYCYILQYMNKHFFNKNGNFLIFVSFGVMQAYSTLGVFSLSI